MNKIFPLPFSSFMRIANSNGGLSAMGLLNTAPWLLKTICFEPLRWIEILTQKKKIDQHKIIESPVFILGFYRSGTTYMQQLFMQDKRLGFTSSYQMVFPELMLSFERAMTPGLEIISRLFKIQNPIHRIPLTWNSAGEEDVAMTTMVSPLATQWGYFFPERMNYFFEKYVLGEGGVSNEEAENWKQCYFYLLKKISLCNRSKKMILKNPPNTARIKLLLSLFPNAKFIHIYRNPFDVYASNKKLWQVIRKIFMLGRSDSVNFNDLILYTYSKIMERYIEDKKFIPAGNLTEIRYENFIERPLETMKNIYNQLNLEEFGQCEPGMIKYINQQKNYTLLKHQLTEEETKMVSEKWKPVIEHFGSN